MYIIYAFVSETVSLRYSPKPICTVCPPESKKPQDTRSIFLSTTFTELLSPILEFLQSLLTDAGSDIY